MVNPLDHTLDFAVQLLKKNGIRPSMQRVRILHYLHQVGGHPTVDDIYRALAPLIPTLSRVTVYNTLDALVTAKLVRVVEIDDAQKRYDVTLDSHGHFLCEGCGMIFNFTVDVEAVAAEGLGGFQVLHKNVYFKGKCPNCRIGS